MPSSRPRTRTQSALMPARRCAGEAGRRCGAAASARGTTIASFADQRGRLAASRHRVHLLHTTIGRLPCRFCSSTMSERSDHQKPTRRPVMKPVRALTVLTTLCCASLTAMAQTTPPPADEPGWDKGRPKSETAMKMAPVPAFPIPTAADKLPTAKFKLPPGFKVETWASGVLDAREMRQGDKGNVFVSTLFVANKVYVLPEQGKREAKVIIDKMPLATGIEFHKGNLYVATNTKILRYDGIEDKLASPGEPKVLYDKLPGGTDHSWKYLRIHNDKLY